MFTTMQETMLLIAMKATRDLSSEVGDSVPVDLCRAAALLGYTIEHAPIQVAGYIPEGENAIVVRCTDLPTRQRFTIAHEIGHVLWRRVCKRGRRGKGAFRERRYNQEERIADQLATELLMPTDIFEAELARHRTPSFGAAYSLASLFGVSYECCIRRVTEARDTVACAYWYWLERLGPHGYEIHYRKGYHSRPGLQFIERPIDAASKCVEHVMRHGGRWRAFLHLRNEDSEFQVPIEAEVARERNHTCVRILGWRHLSTPMVSPIQASQLVI